MWWWQRKHREGGRCGFHEQLEEYGKRWTRGDEINPWHGGSKQQGHGGYVKLADTKDEHADNDDYGLDTDDDNMDNENGTNNKHNKFYNIDKQKYPLAKKNSSSVE